jgi:hypothetical protein
MHINETIRRIFPMLSSFTLRLWKLVHSAGKNGDLVSDKRLQHTFEIHSHKNTLKDQNFIFLSAAIVQYILQLQRAARVHAFMISSFFSISLENI